MQTWKIRKQGTAGRTGAGAKWKTRAAAVLLLLATFVAGMYDFPFVWNGAAGLVEAKTGWRPPTLSDDPHRLGLDLRGGTHLVYEADMAQIPEADRLEALEGARDVIERRVNAFGVSEPVVQTTSTGGAYRVIVELAGVLDVREAIAQIGETPVLEFKEPGLELAREATPEEQAQLETAQAADRASAEDALRRALSGENFDALVAELSADANKEATKGVLDGIAPGTNLYSPMAQAVIDARTAPGRVVPKVVESQEGLIVEKFVSQSRSTDMLLSHILICWKGAVGCAAEIPQIEASLKTASVREQVTPENFAELAGQYSSDKSGDGTGDLGWVAPGDLVPPFELAARGLAVGAISGPVETEYGYHLIYKRDERPVTTYAIQRILFPTTRLTDIVGDASPWKNTELSGKHLARSVVQFDQTTGEPIISLAFNGDGADLFGTLTERLVGSPIAIFLDGQIISSPVVNQAIYGGQAVISGNFTLDEAKLLSQRLNAGALPVPVELLSQQTVGPTLGAASLDMSVKASLVGFGLVALYMVAYYRLAGLFSVVALVLYAFLNLAVYRAFGVTITLSGIAGFVLSLGMAVDANVLIIERMKDEVAGGRDLTIALREGFARAWPAIRDGNVATLVVAVVLYVFSASFIRGFALMLGIGVLVSLVTAIGATRAYMMAAFPAKVLRWPCLSGLSSKKR
jgi:protein-export membrane protein SecD